MLCSGSHLWGVSKYKETLNYVRELHYSSVTCSVEKVYKEKVS